MPPQRGLAAWTVPGGLLALAAQGWLADEERSAYAYFGKGSEHGSPQPVARYANVSRAQFEHLAQAGRPFVLEDGGRDQPFVGWTCQRFREEFPNGVVKIEYVKGVKAVWSIKDPWEKELHPIPRADPDGPQYAPWYWGVKGADEPEEARTVFEGGRSPLPLVQATMRLPPFMSDSPENQREVFGSPEFWFSAPGAGATMHMDAHCESTFAIQLSGKRRWRVGWAPFVPNGTLYKEGTYADGAVYGKQYVPPMEAVVSEGEGFFMPSGFLHETNNVGDACAVSLTVQFADPIPAQYFRQSLRHLRRAADFRECWELLGKVAGLGRAAEEPLRRLTAADGDGDGRLSTKEASSSRMLRASHAFHDVDQDGFVTAEELQTGWSAWMAADAEARAKDIKKVRPKSFAYLGGSSVEL